MERRLYAVCFVVSQMSAMAIESTTGSNLTDQVTRLEQAMSSLQAHLASSDRKLATALSKLNTTSDEVVAVKTEMRMTQDVLFSSQKEVKTTKDEVEAMKSRIKSMEAEISVLKNDTQHRPSNSEVTAMKSDLDHLILLSQSPQPSINVTVIDVIRKDVKTNAKNVGDLNVELANIKQKYNETRLELDLSVQGRKHMKGQVNSLSSRINDTEGALKQLELEVHEHALRMNTSDISLTDSGKDLKKTQEDIKSLRTHLVDGQTELRGAIANTSLTTARLEDTVRDLQSWISGMKSNVSSIGQYSHWASREIHSLKTTLNNTRVEVSRVASDLNSLVADINSKFSSLGANSVGSTVTGHKDKGVAFQASPSVDKSGWTVLTFDMVGYNQGGGYDPSSGLFTAPLSGTYLFWTNVLIRGPSANVYINKGAQRLAAGFAVTAYPYNISTASAVAVAHVTVGQQIHFYIDSAADTLHTAMESFIGGVLVHADYSHC